MSKLLVLYDFNSYYNRKIFRLSSFQEYVDLITPVGNNPAQYRGFIRENMNFDFQDGVSASHVINIYKTDPQYMKTEHPNYCVLEETYTEGSGENITTTKKVTRWFILDVVKVRGNQWQYALKRDVLADYYDNVLDAPVFIERGNIMNEDSPLLFNRESMTFNQVKKAEYLLNQTKFSGNGQGWIVGYLARKESQTDIGPCVADVIAPEESAIDYDTLPADLKTAITRGYYDLVQSGNVEINLIGYTGYSSDQNGGIVTIGDNSSAFLYFPYPFHDATGGLFTILGGAPAQTRVQDWITYGYSSYWSYIRAAILRIAGNDPNYNPQSTDWRTNYNSILIRKDGKLYQLNMSLDSYSYSHEYTYTGLVNVPDLAQPIYAYVQTVCDNSQYFNSRNQFALNKRTVITNIDSQRISVSLSEKDFGTTSVTLKADRNSNYEAPYDIFCIPYGSVQVKNNGTTLFTTLNNVALASARAIAITGGSNVYDIQILPYCPFGEIIDNSGAIDLTGFTENHDYNFITKTIPDADPARVGIVIYPKEARGTFDITIPNTASVYNRCIKIVNDPLEKKIASETTFARFVSPNFASQFEINIQKNNGIVNINVDYFLKPYSPYIHVAPYFSGLYGEDYNDPKGLICSGDFSIAAASSQWQEYQIQNKNYELIFNRQVQNIDVNNSIELRKAKVQAWTGGGAQTVAGGAGGAVAGGAIGTAVAPGAGTVAGAVIGGIGGAALTGGLSGLGGFFDIKYLKESQREARSFFISMYNANLGNIQALPYSLTRVSSYTPNNKIFPFIEFYDCTDIEKEALRKKLIYNGANVGVIGKIRDYLGNENFVSGELIRLEGLEEDSQVITEIAEEIKEGAYYYGNTI